ncbi:MAG: B12-binding domain-containing radical SAM protein [Pirellulales bacterium]|nr:B12-binding domain-containing radical SAM protein [Pirellulales bacterium]
MPHVAFVPLTGLRVGTDEVRELGMTLPGLKTRVGALTELPALGLLTLAGMTPETWTSSYHPAADWDESLVEEVFETEPALVAISALTASIDEAYRISAAFRARKTAVVIGGLHATVCAEEAAQHADAVVVGDGESVWHDVLADIERKSLRRIYRGTGPFDLAQAPLPRFDLLGERAPARWTLQTERGCPFACDFCGASRLLGPFREKPIERIRAELVEINRYSQRPWLELADDNTFAGGRDVDELLTTLGDSGARYFTEVDWRIGERPDVLQRLAESGCVQVLIGVESLEFRYPGMGAKQGQTERMMDAIRAIQEAGVVVNGCFIVGADGETDASLDHLTRFILESPLAEVQITLQTPFPGTGLFERLKHRGRLLADRGWSHYTLFDVTYHPKPLTVEQLESGFRRVLASVFAKPEVERRSALRKDIWRRHSTS